MSKGFKETEIGKIPSEWDIASIANAFDIQQGKSLSARNQTGEFKKPFLRTSNVYWGHLDLSTIDEMDFSKDEREKLKFKYGDVLVCEGGEVGRTAIWRNELAECYYQNHIFRLRPRDGNTSPFYFVYWMQAGYLELKIYVGAGNKTTIPNLSRSRLSQFVFPRPPLPEQKKIATVLSKLQKAIEIQDKILGSLRDLKKSAMHHLFTYGLRDETIRETDIGSAPGHWSIRKFSDYVTLQRGQDLTRVHFATGEVPVIGATQILGYHNTANVKGPGVTVVRSGSSAGFAQFIGCDFWAHNVVMYVKHFNGNNPMFVCYHLNQIGLSRFRSGVAVPTLNRNTFASLTVGVPDIAEQTEIAHILQTIDHKIEIHEGKKASYQDLFKTMLNKLMTGIIRVNELDIDTSEVEAA